MYRQFLRFTAIRPSAVLGLLVAGCSSTDPVDTAIGTQGWAVTANTIFADEFSGTALDTTKWTAPERADTIVSSLWNSPNNISVANGIAGLRMTDNNRTDGRNHTAGFMTTEGKFSFLYGHVEIRAQFPSAAGLWPGIWMLGDRCNDTTVSQSTCPWPLPGSDEIDIFEEKTRNPTQPFFSNHYGTIAQQDHLVSCQPTTANTVTGFHVYTIDWAPGVIDWGMDGSPVCHSTTGVPSQPMFLRMEVDGGTDNPIDETALQTASGSTLQVDYVRITSPNSVRNLGFEDDQKQVAGAPNNWQVTSATSTPGASTTYGNGLSGATSAHPGNWYLEHWSGSAYQVYTYQLMTGLANGSYTATAWVQSSGGQTTAQMVVKNYGASEVDVPIVGSTTWTQLSKTVSVSNGQAEIGFLSNAAANQWIIVDDVHLEPAASAGSNPIANPGFEAAASQTIPSWGEWSPGSDTDASYTENYGGAHTGSLHMTHWKPSAYTVYTFQGGMGNLSGARTVTFWYKSSGGQTKVELDVKYGGSASVADSMAIPAAANWTKATKTITVPSGQALELGFYSVAGANQWLYIDDISVQ